MNTCTCHTGPWETCVTCWREVMLQKCSCDVAPETCELHTGAYLSLPVGTVPPREKLLAL